MWSRHAEAKVGPVEDQAETAPPSWDVDEHLVAVAALSQLDARTVDKASGLVALARDIELDDGLVAVDRLEGDLPRRHPQVERQRAGRVEALAPHRPDLTTRRRRASRGSRGS